MEAGNIWVTILAGGTGSRFWPLSRPERPKQVLSLSGSRPLVAETLERAKAIVPLERIRILAGPHLVPLLRQAMPELPEAAFLVEPEARGTAPVLAWAAWMVHREDPGAVMVSLHADHHIEPLSDFVALVRGAAAVAEGENLLMTVGVTPDRPETGYGYTQPGAALHMPEGLEGYRVRRFHEKPDLETAKRYVDEGYLWNSGIFIWTAADFLEAVRECAPEIGRHLGLLEDGQTEAFFAASPKLTVDVAVMERSSNVGVAAATFQWDDIGAWHSLSRVKTPDEQDNVVVGNARIVEGGGNVVYADEGTIVLFGVEDLVVVRTGEVTLVARKDRTGDLKSLLDQLPHSIKGAS